VTPLTVPVSIGCQSRGWSIPQPMIWHVQL